VEFFVYIMTNTAKTPLYIGVTNNLGRRVYEHQQGLQEGFTKKYRLTKLVYYEIHPYVLNAIQREKSLKRWYREWKIRLIEKDSPHWEDLGRNLSF